MNVILILILFILLIIICKKHGVKLFLSLVYNFLILMVAFYTMSCGFNAIVVSLIACIFIARVGLFYVNGKNLKTKSALKSLVIVLFILSLSIYSIVRTSRIAGFGIEAEEEINMFSYDIALDFTKISTALVLIGLIGACIDSSIAIASALYELKENNKNITFKELFASGLNIGKDILGTTMNTLLFAFLGEFMTLLLWFITCSYSIGDIINAKEFVSEFIKIVYSAIGCIMVIPITAYITSIDLTRED